MTTTNNNYDEIMMMGTYDGGGGGADGDPGAAGSGDRPPVVGAGSGSGAGFPGSTKKLREILRRQKNDSDDEETPDVDFTYDDEVRTIFSGNLFPEMS